MYHVDAHDRVERLKDVPRSDAGAPAPALVADEHRLLLAYLVGDDGNRANAIEANATEWGSGESVAIVRFDPCFAHFAGPPGDEISLSHPLAARGLRPYGAYEVIRSPWIRELAAADAVHPRHRPDSFAKKRHFIFTFHDSTFECIADGYAARVVVGNPMEVLASAWSE